MSQFQQTIKKRPIHFTPGLHYRLYRLCDTDQQCYCITVRYLSDRATCTFFARSDSLAREIYRKIVNGKVTPCTLNDVVQDLTS